jgi:hypothetical protein
MQESCLRPTDDYWNPVDLETDPDLYFNKDLEVSDGLHNCCFKDKHLLEFTDSHNLVKENKFTKQRLGEGLVLEETYILLRREDMTRLTIIMRLPIPSPDTYQEVVDKLLAKNLIFKLIIGGYCIVQMPLLVNLLILDKLQDIGQRSKDSGLSVFDNNWMSTLNEDEIHTTRFTYGQGNLTVHNRFTQPYIPDVYFLDIPILLDFFLYGIDLQVINLYLQQICVVVQSDLSDVAHDSYLNDIVLFPETSTYYNGDARRTIASLQVDYGMMDWLLLSSTLDSCTAQLKLELYKTTTKFIYIVICNNNQDCEVFSLPEITGCRFINDGDNTYIDPDMFYLADYDRGIRVYVISPDPNIDMKNWIEVINEFKPSDHRAGEDKVSNNNNNISNIMFPSTRCQVCMLTFNELSNADITCYGVSQNVFSIRDGMCGKRSA